MEKRWLRALVSLIPFFCLCELNVRAAEILHPSSDPAVLGMVVDSEGVWRDVVFLPTPDKGKQGSNPASVHQFILQEKQHLGINPGNLTLVRELVSGGNYVATFQQYWNGKRVFDADLQLVSRDGQVICLRNRTSSVRIQTLEPDLTTPDILSAILGKGGVPINAPELGIYQNRWAYRVQVNFPTDACELTLDAHSMDVLYRRSLLHFERTGTGFVFYPNPISSSGDPSLTDGEDLATDFLNGERVHVSLPLLDDSGYLRNRYVDLTAQNINMALMGGNGVLGYTPGSARWDELGGVFDYDRDDFRFEEVNVYYWVTRACRYIEEELGFPQAVNYRIPVHVHYMYNDNSFYSETDRGLHFGDGGVDDAEDAEIVLHEMGHAIIHNVIPGFGGSWEARSMDEGISDYIAASLSDDAHFPDTIGEWDASFYDFENDNPPHLRPIVTDRIYPDNLGDPYPRTYAADIHWDGVIFSSTLWQIREHIGSTEMDTILFQGLPTFSSDASFSSAALRLLNAGTFQYGNTYSPTIRYFFTKRGIMSNSYIQQPVPDFGKEMVVFPYVNRSDEWNTEVVLLNPGEVSAGATVHVIGDNGCTVYPKYSVDIPPGGRIQWSPLKGRVPSSCWVLVTSSMKLAGYAKIISMDGSRGAFIPGSSGLSDQLLVEHIAPEVEYWDTRSTVVNASETEPVVLFNVRGEESLSLDPLSTPFSQVDMDWLEDVYSGAYPEDFDGWGTLSTDLPILAGTELFRKKGNGRQQLAGLRLGDEPASVLYIPHVHVEGNYWWTGIVVVNPAEEVAPFTVEAYADNGVKISEVDLQLEAGHKLVSLIQNIWTDNGRSYPEETAWVKIVSPQVELTGSFLFGTLEQKGDRLLAGISFARSPATQLLFGQVTTDPQYWTGISFINTGSSAAQITVQALDDEGTVLAEETWLELMAPDQKHVSLAGEMFSEGLPQGTTQVRVLSDQPLIGFELWGNLVPRQDYICGMLAFPATGAQ